MRLLVVDDDRDLASLLRFSLARAGFDVLVAHEARGARDLIAEQQPSLILLDVDLGGWNGLELLRETRHAIPTILLTGHDREEDVVAGLEAGAVDYITKPFSYRELVARIRGHLDRAGHTLPEVAALGGVLEASGVRLDLDRHTVHRDGRLVPITVTEFRVLQLLMRSAGRVVETTHLLRTVWGGDVGSDVVRVTIHRLRRKLNRQPGPDLVRTVSGVGFLFEADRTEGSQLL